MRITDKKFVECYCKWSSHVNWYAAHVFLTALDRTANLEAKKALFVKIFFEYIQASEHLLVLVDALKKSGTVAGLKERIVKCPSGGDAFRYLWKDVRRFHKNPFKLYAYLGIPLTKDHYHSDQKAFDGFSKALFACLRNRYANTRAGRTSRVMKAFNKIKHGFPVYTAEGSDTVHFLVSAGRKTRDLPFRFDHSFAKKLCGSCEAIRNSIGNFSAILLER